MGSEQTGSTCHPAGDSLPHSDMTRRIRDTRGEVWEVIEEQTQLRTRSPHPWPLQRLHFRHLRTGEQREIGSMIELKALSDADLRRRLQRAKHRMGSLDGDASQSMDR